MAEAEIPELRTYRPLRPRKFHFKPYTRKQVYEILADRASKSHQPRSVHRNAATDIAPTTPCSR
jgi:Cdc6-like AAA superfamily ATPase